jgi:hypothetical protein
MTVKIKNRWEEIGENLKIMTLGTLDLNSCYQNTAIKKKAVYERHVPEFYC